MLKFDSQQSRDAVLTRGTWYVGRRPMVVTCWGVKPGRDCVNSMPIWIKLSGVPDAYWTEEGLSRRASVVGRPLGADSLTSKLELLPFAKIRVLYTLGDPLPTEVSAVVLDPASDDKSIVKVNISYPFRPLSCSGCKSLGHSVGACPKVSRIWVQKAPIAGSDHQETETSKKEQPGAVKTPCEQTDKDCGTMSIQENNDSWTEVKRKKTKVPDAVPPSPRMDSPSPPRTFKNLKNVDEIDKRKAVHSSPSSESGASTRLTRSQKKKLRLQKGSTPPNPSS